MESASPDSSSGRSPLPTYRPDEGMAIGHNPADFTATGPGAEPGMGPAFAGMVVTELTQAPCAASEAPPYQIVESANPGGMALIEAELALQADPAFDPDEKITPHIIAATHLVKGTFSFTEESLTAELRVEDLEGEVIAQAAATGPIDSPFEIVEEAARSLAEQLCGKLPQVVSKPKQEILPSWRLRAGRRLITERPKLAGAKGETSSSALSRPICRWSSA